MMSCEEARGATVLAAYGELEPHRHGALRAHLIACAECAAQARDVRAARALVAHAEGHDMPGSPVVGPPRPEIPSDAVQPPRSRGMTAASWAVAAAVLIVAVVALVQAHRTARSGRETLVASGAVAPGASEPRASEPVSGDTLDDEIESLRTELSSLESRVREF